MKTIKHYKELTMVQLAALLLFQSMECPSDAPQAHFLEELNGILSNILGTNAIDALDEDGMIAGHEYLAPEDEEELRLLYAFDFMEALSYLQNFPPN
jgi:hypothetical protein